MPSISASVVVYKSPLAELEQLFASLHDSALVETWVAVDNAAIDDPIQSAALREVVERYNGTYVGSPGNIGFGGGHNLALKALYSSVSDFHLMLNPDILFAPNVLSTLSDILQDRPEVGLIMPRVLYPNGEDQFLCKLLPTPLDFALRRFAPAFVQRIARTRMNRYELRGLENTECDCVPFLSGCFMFTRRRTLESIGGFDDRYFLYLEDVDLCRRIAARSKLLYWPEVSVTHGYHRGAHRSFGLMFAFLQSAVRYFNKWGWFFDPQRRHFNRVALSKLHEVTGHERSA